MATEDICSTPFNFKKYAVFTGLWTLMRMFPQRYAMLIDCNSNDKFDWLDARKPLLLLESDMLVAGNKATPRSGDMGVAYMAPEKILNVQEYFVDCVKKRVSLYREAGLECTGKDIPSAGFCCNLYHRTTQMFLYDKLFSRLYFFHRYEADEEPLNRNLLNDRRKFLECFPKNVKEVLDSFKKIFIKLSMKNLPCYYIKSYGLEEIFIPKHKRLTLFRCLRNGVRKKDGWESVDVESIFEKP